MQGSFIGVVGLLGWTPGLLSQQWVLSHNCYCPEGWAGRQLHEGQQDYGCCVNESTAIALGNHQA